MKTGILQDLLTVSSPGDIPKLHLAPDIRLHEPRLALDGGADGLDIYRALIPAAAARATKAVLVEIGHDQGAAVSALFAQAGLEDVRVLKDLGGNDRVVEGRVTRDEISGG